MKKSIIILLFFIALGANAQGNLQFNQVKLVSALETVPAGKVWKVESILYNVNLPGPPPNSGLNDNIIRDDGISVNGNFICTRSIRSAGSYYYNKIVNYYTWSLPLPIWLPEGTNLNANNNVLYISIIEFNITK